MIKAHNDNRHRWGIIYCPRVGAWKPMKRWSEIRDYLKERGVEYDLLQSENFSSIERLTRVLADNGYETIVLVGGDGALQDAINGIMASQNRSRVAFGLVPNGIANDFARYWGLDAGDYKHAIDCIMAHRTRAVDVGYCSYTTAEGEQTRYFLNVLNIGLTAHLVEIANRRHYLFARAVSSLTGLAHLLFHRQNYNMKITLNNQTVEQKFMMLCIGNSRGYGMTPSAVPYNGRLDVSAIKMPKFLGMLQGLYMVARRKIMNYKLMVPFRTTEILIESVDNARAGIDGRPFAPTYPMRVGIEPEAFNFIIPNRKKQNRTKYDN